MSDLEKSSVAMEIIAFVSYFQFEALKRGYAIRGGISYDSYYKNDLLVWGKALVESVVLEEEKPHNPEVLVSGQMIHFLNTLEISVSEDVFAIDDDNKKFIDYLYFMREYPSIVEEAIQTINNSKWNQTEKAKIKIEWINGYYRKFMNLISRD